VPEEPSSSQSAAPVQTIAFPLKSDGRLAAVVQRAPASVETMVETVEALPSANVTHVVADPQDIGPAWPKPVGSTAVAHVPPESVVYSTDPLAAESVQSAVVGHVTVPNPVATTPFGIVIDDQLVPPSVECSSSVESPLPFGTENVA
jgi:hypothetical protein